MALECHNDFLIDNAAATAYLEKKSINYFNELSTFEAVIMLAVFLLK